MCSKMSGWAAGYTDKQSFNKLNKFLSHKHHIKASQCSSAMEIPNTYKLKSFLGATDVAVEGDYRLLKNSGTKVNFLPWLPNRPYAGSTKYNCLSVEMELQDTGSTLTSIINAKTADEECLLIVCAVCQIAGPVLKIKVRGLCELSLFDKEYIYSINSDGTPLLRGPLSSTIVYNSAISRW